MAIADTRTDAFFAPGNAFREAVNLWGTSHAWREGAIEILREEGVNPDRWFDPMLPPGVENPDAVFNEVDMAGANRYDATVISPNLPGRISKIELGHTILKMVRGGTEAHISVSPLVDDDESSVRARKLVMAALEQMRILLPPELVQNVDPASSAIEQQQMLDMWLHKIGGKIVTSQNSGLEWVTTTPPALESQPLGERRVFLSGTSVASSAAKEAFKATAARLGLPVVDSYTGEIFTQDDIDAEYEQLRASQAVVVMITNDTDTIAGTSEAPIRAALAAMNLNRRKQDGTPLPQAFGLFVEESDSNKLSDYAIELRRALLLHVHAIQRKFPGAIYLAQSPEALATWAARSQS